MSALILGVGAWYILILLVVICKLLRRDILIVILFIIVRLNFRGIVFLFVRVKKAWDRRPPA